MKPVNDLNQGEGAPPAGDATFRAVSEGASAAIFIYQSRGFIYSNLAMCVITGYSDSELRSMTFEEIAHPDVRDEVHKRESTRPGGELLQQRYEMKILTKSGEERWLDVSSSRLDVHGTPAIVGVAVDITDRKRHEEQLKSLVGKLHDSASKLQGARGGKDQTSS